MLGNISYHQYITTARLQINFTNRVKDMLKFAAQVSTPPFSYSRCWRIGDPAETEICSGRPVSEPLFFFDIRNGDNNACLENKRYGKPYRYVRTGYGTLGASKLLSLKFLTLCQYPVIFCR